MKKLRTRCLNTPILRAITFPFDTKVPRQKETEHKNILYYKRGYMKTIVEIPHLPDGDLNPNKRVHWGALADAKRNAKQVMMSALKDNDNPVFIPDEPYESAILKIEFVAGFKDRQRKNRTWIIYSHQSSRT